MRMWLDADACPRVIKDILYRAAQRRAVRLTLVANSRFAIPSSEWIDFLQVGAGFDKADTAIADNAQDGDLVITATGLNLQLFGGMQITVDGEPVDFSRKVAFKGMMLDGVPNFAFAVGYTNSSWTLKVGLLCEHFCRLIKHTEQRAKAQGLTSIFVLSTRTMHWFIKRGFKQVDPDWLPAARKNKYNWDRKSQVFVKQL